MDVKILLVLALLGLIVSFHIGITKTQLEELDKRIKALETK